MKKQLLLTFGLMIMFVCKIQAQAVEIDGIHYFFTPENKVKVIAKNPRYSRNVIIPSRVLLFYTFYPVTSIDDYAFYACYGLESVTIGNSVTSIGNYAFLNSYLTSIFIGNSVTSIGNSAFAGCIGLSTITIPNSVTSIGNSAFAGCTELTSVFISNSVTSIGEGAFDNCTGLTSITSKALTPPVFGNQISLGMDETIPTKESEAFLNVDKSIPLYVPLESVDLYKTADQWKDFNVQPIIITNTTKLSANSNFKIYPNPASSVVTLETTDLNTSSNFQLFDNSGKLVLSEQVSGTTQLSIESLKSGMYLYQVSQNGNNTTGKLIVK